MNDKIVKLFAEESKIVMFDGMIMNGAVEVSGYVSRVIEGGFALGVNRGLKIGFIGGVTTCCVGAVAYKYYVRRNPKLNGEGA